MVKNRLKSLSAAFLVMLLFKIAPASGLEIVLAMDNTPGDPYIMGGGYDFNKTRPGIEIEIYQLVAKRLNLKIKFTRIPWKRCLKGVSMGHYDGVFPTSFKPERLAMGAFPIINDQIDLSRQTRMSAYHLYTLNEIAVDWNGRQFVGLDHAKRSALGAPLGWSIVGDLKRMGVPVVEKCNLADLVEMLRLGGVAGVVCLETAMDAHLKQKKHKLDFVKKHGIPVVEKVYYLMFSHQFQAKHPVLCRQIWNQIKKIKNSPDYEKIQARYL